MTVAEIDRDAVDAAHVDDYELVFDGFGWLEALFTGRVVELNTKPKVLQGCLRPVQSGPFLQTKSMS